VVLARQHTTLSWDERRIPAPASGWPTLFEDIVAGKRCFTRLISIHAVPIIVSDASDRAASPRALKGARSRALNLE